MAVRTRASVFVLVVLTHHDSDERVIDKYWQALSEKGLALHEERSTSQPLRIEKRIEKWEGSPTQSAVVIEVAESSHQKDLLEFFKGIGLEGTTIERHIERAGEARLSVDDLETVRRAFGGSENLVREMKDYRGLLCQFLNPRLELTGLFVQIKSAKRKIEEMIDKVKVPFIEVNRLMLEYLKTFHKEELNKFGELDEQGSPLDEECCLIKSKAKTYEEWDRNVESLKRFYGEKTQGLLLWSLTETKFKDFHKKVPEPLGVSLTVSELCKRLTETCPIAVYFALDGKIKIVCKISDIEKVKQKAQAIFEKWLPLQQAEPESASGVEVNITNNDRNEENDTKNEKQVPEVDSGNTIV